MKISLKWLNDYVQVDDYFSKPAELAGLLTSAGLEVEEIEDQGRAYRNVVVGHILEKAQHPNADRLSLCQVTTGTGVVHQIVCGAQNHKQGDRVVVALPGAVLPGNFEIKQSKIRGVDSGGMLCSEKELGLKPESEGILILPADAEIGKPFAEYSGRQDVILDIKVTPNRADCLSHLGLAREIGALLGRSCELRVESLIESEMSTQKLLRLEVKDTQACPRYCGRAVRGVKVGPSPDWLRQRLESVGLKSINNIVDVTNYVMFETGQPLHAFDLSDIRGGVLQVARAQAGEDFTTLDGTKIQLSADDLSIRDGERVLALAGVVGGQNSGVKETTRDIFIEAANFQPTVVRRSSRRHGIDTDSAYRFARGVDPQAVSLSLNRAAQLIQSVAGGDICREAYDIYPHPFEKKPIHISMPMLSQRLGYKAEPTAFVNFMTRLGCQVQRSESDEMAWSVLPPAFRSDLSIDMDLVEEYARLNGYHHIPEVLPISAGAPAKNDSQYLFDRRVRRLLHAQGYLQIINYAFLNDQFQKSVLGSHEKLLALGLTTASHAVKIKNPLTEELNVMRLALLPGVLKVVQHNSRHGNHFGQVFETGAVHLPQSTSTEGNQFAQEQRACLAAWGRMPGLWNQKSETPLIFQLKAAVENLLVSLQIKDLSFSPLDSANGPEFLHPGQSAGVKVEGKLVGFIGVVHPNLLSQLKIREVTAVAEINLDRLAQGQPRALRSKPISLFPSVDRDLALVLPKAMPSSEPMRLMRQAAGQLLQEIEVFDIFEGGSLPAGHKSVAYRLVFQDLQSTLDDQRVNALRDQVVKALEESLKISVRS